MGQEKDTAATLPPGRGSGEGHSAHTSSRAWVRIRTQRPHFTSPGEPPERGSGEGHSAHTSLPLERPLSVGQEKDTAVTLHFPWRASRAWVRRRTQRPHFTSPGAPPERGSGEGHSGHTSRFGSRAWVRRRTQRSHFTIWFPSVGQEKDTAPTLHDLVVVLPSVGQEKDTAPTLHDLVVVLKKGF